MGERPPAEVLKLRWEAGSASRGDGLKSGGLSAAFFACLKPNPVRPKIPGSVTPHGDFTDSDHIVLRAGENGCPARLLSGTCRAMRFVAAGSSGVFLRFALLRSRELSLHCLMVEVRHEFVQILPPGNRCRRDLDGFDRGKSSLCYLFGPGVGIDEKSRWFLARERGGDADRRGAGIHRLQDFLFHGRRGHHPAGHRLRWQRLQDRGVKPRDLPGQQA